MEIITLSFNRPDFIELQLNSIKKFHKDFKYTVYDNCPDDSVKNECERLGVECIPIKIFSSDPSVCVGLSLDKMWETLQYNKGKLWYIDSDMFLIAPLPDIETDMAFVLQVRGEYTYPWTGLMYFNMDTMPAKHTLQFKVDKSVRDTDVGGLNHFYLHDFNPSVTELEEWTLTPDGYSYNGVDCLPKPFHREMEIRYDLPKPFDLLTKNGIAFILHYKSASNYPDFYTPEYNENKTKKLCRLLM